MGDHLSGYMPPPTLNVAVKRKQCPSPTSAAKWARPASGDDPDSVVILGATRDAPVDLCMTDSDDASVETVHCVEDSQSHVSATAQPTPRAHGPTTELAVPRDYPPAYRKYMATHQTYDAATHATHSAEPEATYQHVHIVHQADQADDDDTASSASGRGATPPSLASIATSQLLSLCEPTSSADELDPREERRDSTLELPAFPVPTMTVPTMTVPTMTVHSCQWCDFRTCSFPQLQSHIHQHVSGVSDLPPANLLCSSPRLTNLGLVLAVRPQPPQDLKPPTTLTHFSPTGNGAVNRKQCPSPTSAAKRARVADEVKLVDYESSSDDG